MTEIAADLADALEDIGGFGWPDFERVRRSLRAKLAAVISGEDVPEAASTSEGRSWPGADVGLIRSELERRLVRGVVDDPEDAADDDTARAVNR